MVEFIQAAKEDFFELIDELPRYEQVSFIVHHVNPIILLRVKVDQLILENPPLRLLFISELARCLFLQSRVNGHNVMQAARLRILLERVISLCL